MKSSVESLSKLQKKLIIEVPIETVRDSFKKAYAGVQKNAAVKGFRKGKVPMNMIKSMYKEKVTPDVLNDLINEGYFAALSEHKLNPIDMPQINVDAFGEEEGLRFSATLELRPDVDLKKIEGLEVKKEKLDIKDERVDAVLQDLQKHHAELVPLLEDRPAQNGDVSVIDFKGFIGLEPLPGGDGTDHELELGSNQFIPGFEEGIVGMRVGAEKDLRLTFPADYHAKEIAGKEVLFKVTLKSLKKKSLPAIDDALAKKVGDHENLQQLKDAIRADIKEGEESRIKNELKDRLLKALVKANPVEVPASMKEKQKQRLIEDLQNRMRREGLNQGQFEEYKQKWDKDFDETAETMIQSSFLIGAIAEKYDLHVKDEDFDKKMQEYSQQVGIDIQRLKEFYGKPEQRNRLEFQIAEDKVVDFLLSKAKVTEVAKEKLES